MADENKNDFYDWVNMQRRPDAPLFPNHPAEMEALPRATLPKGKYRVFYRQFCLKDKEQADELQEVVTMCLSNPNWILIREEWSVDQQGNRIITLKYMNFIPDTKKREGAP